MRILHVSKFAEITGGVERNIHDLMQAQRAAGDNAAIFSSEDLGAPRIDLDPGSGGTAVGKVQVALQVGWSREAREALDERLATFQPDVIHYHSVYHQLSPSVLPRRNSRVPSVITLHDYKLAAPCYILMRDGQPCFDCTGKTIAIGCIKHRCVKGSLAASLVCSAEFAAHRSRYRRRIDRYIFPSQFAADVICGSGAVDEVRSRIVPHGVAKSQVNPDPGASRRVLFIGRLAPEKALLDVVNVWSRVYSSTGLHLDVLGDGPDRATAEGLCVPGITFHGWQEQSAIHAALASARAIVVPSRFCETFGLAAAEALAAGVPVVSSDAGALPELVQKSGGGLSYRAGDLDALLMALVTLDDAGLVRALGDRGRAFAADELTLTKMAARTTDVYLDAMSSR